MPNIRKPNNLHILNGTYRQDRHGQSVDVKTPIPPCPDYLHPLAKQEWQRIVELLEPLDVLRASDFAIMQMYCELFAHIKTEGVGNVKTSVLQTFRSLANDLGLTPIARQKVKMDTKKKEKGSFDEF